MVSVCIWLEHKLNTNANQVGVLDHEDRLPADSVHLAKVCLAVVTQPLTVELGCPPQPEAVVGSHIAV